MILWNTWNSWKNTWMNHLKNSRRKPWKNAWRSTKRVLSRMFKAVCEDFLTNPGRIYGFHRFPKKSLREFLGYSWRNSWRSFWKYSKTIPGNFPWRCSSWYLKINPCKSYWNNCWGNLCRNLWRKYWNYHLRNSWKNSCRHPNRNFLTKESKANLLGSYVEHSRKNFSRSLKQSRKKKTFVRMTGGIHRQISRGILAGISDNFLLD